MKTVNLSCYVWKTVDGKYSLVKYSTLADPNEYMYTLSLSEESDKKILDFGNDDPQEGFPRCADLALSVATNLRVFDPTVISDSLFKLGLGDGKFAEFYYLKPSSIIIKMDTNTYSSMAIVFSRILENFDVTVINTGEEFTKEDEEGQGELDFNAPEPVEEPVEEQSILENLEIPEEPKKGRRK